MSRCCGNCEWSVSPELEEQIMEEQSYDENDPNRPRAGDCCIGQEHNDEFFCSHHIYVSGMEEYKNYVFYDDEYMGPGYLIVSKIDGEVDRFMKIGINSNVGFPNFFIRAYARGCKDTPADKFRSIFIDIKKGEPLYDLVYNLGRALGEEIFSNDPVCQGKNHFQVACDIDGVSLCATKDVYGVKSSTDFVDVSIGDEYTCEKYPQFLEFYNNLSTISMGKISSQDIKQLLKK